MRGEELSTLKSEYFFNYMEQSKNLNLNSEMDLKSKIAEIEGENEFLIDETNTLPIKIKQNIDDEILHIKEFEEETLNNCKIYRDNLAFINSDLRHLISKYQQKIEGYNCRIQRLFKYIILLIVILAVNYFLILYQPLPSLFSFINGLTIAISIALLIGAIINARYLFQIREGLNSKEFVLLTHKLDEYHLQQNKTNLHNLNFDDIFCKDSILKFIYTLRGLSVSTAETIPLIKLLFDQYRKKANWDIICEDVENSLRYYKLDCHNEIGEINISPPWESEISDNDKIREKAVLQNLADKYQKRGLGINYQILSLLVSHYKGLNTKNLWDEIRQNLELSNICAKIIFDSELLDIDKNVIQSSEFTSIITSCEEFNLNILFQRCLLYQQLISEIVLINEKIIIQGFPLQNQINSTDLLQLTKFNEDFETNFLRILSHELSANIPFERNDSYVNAILAILLNPDPRFKEQVCLNASDFESVVILMGYLQLKRESEENRMHFRLLDIINGKKLYNSIKNQISIENDAYDPEMYSRYDTYKMALQNGRWFSNEITLLQENLLKKIDEVNEDIQQTKKYRILHKIIEKNFENININTVDKAIDANLFSAYVILTHSTKYSLMDTIDKLNADHLQKQEIKEIESKYEICLLKDEKPKYHFKRYLKGTYVGVIDKKTSFTQFNNEFLSDLGKILKIDEEINYDSNDWNFGLIILKITPSKYSFGMLPGYIKSKDFQIAKTISELVNNAGILKISEKATLEIFDKNIDLLEIINQQSICDLITSEGQPISREYESFLKSDALRAAFFQRLREEDINSFKDLAIEIRNHNSQRYFIDISKEVFAIQYRIMKGKDLQTKKLHDFTNDLVTSLEAAAILWDR